MNEISHRFRAVIIANTKEGRRAAQLATRSSIPASSWQKAFDGKQRPTAEMIECVARLWPSFAFWLATGITDARHGHVACRDSQTTAFFPERPSELRSAAGPYFEQALVMFQKIYGQGARLPDEEARHEDQVRLLTLELARVTEEAKLSKAEDEALARELEDASSALHNEQRQRRAKLLAGLTGTADVTD